MFFMLMTSLMTSQGDDKVSLIYPYLNEIKVERRSKIQHFGNTHGYIPTIFNFRYHFRQKSLSLTQNGVHSENVKILNTALI